MRKLMTTLLSGLMLITVLPAHATRFLGIHVIDKQYLMLHFRDGEVHYRDNGTGPSAYLGHSFAEGDDTLLVFGERLNGDVARQVALWQISSSDDKTFADAQPVNVWRKSKPMNTDHTLTSENDHWLFLQLPQAMRQGYTYTVSIPKGIGADQESASVCFDVWNAQSEAIHVNIIGYSPAEQDHAADLYQWMGDGGQRDYSSWEGNKVYLYNVNTKKKQNVGKVKFWKKASAADQEAGGKNLVGTDVWNIDFQGTTPGRYRLVVEDVGCSMDFDIAADVYYQPFRYSVRGYYYMRLGEPKDPEHVWPIPRQPQFIPETDPKGLTVYKTDFHPFCQEWRDLHTDVWDEPHFKPALESRFWQHRLPGNPVNVEVKGGHSDAFDWDRHLAHVSNIYDMLLPYILSGGRLSDDNLGIRETSSRSAMVKAIHRESPTPMQAGASCIRQAVPRWQHGPMPPTVPSLPRPSAYRATTHCASTIPTRPSRPSAMQRNRSGHSSTTCRTSAACRCVVATSASRQLPTSITSRATRPGRISLHRKA